MTKDRAERLGSKEGTEETSDLRVEVGFRIREGDRVLDLIAQRMAIRKHGAMRCERTRF